MLDFARFSTFILFSAFFCHVALFISGLFFQFFRANLASRIMYGRRREQKNLVATIFHWVQCLEKLNFSSHCLSNCMMLEHCIRLLNVKRISYHIFCCCCFVCFCFVCIFRNKLHQHSCDSNESAFVQIVLT